LNNSNSYAGGEGNSSRHREKNISAQREIKRGPHLSKKRDIKGSSKGRSHLASSLPEYDAQRVKRKKLFPDSGAFWGKVAIKVEGKKNS